LHTIVLDTNVVIAATLANGPSRRLLQLALGAEVKLATSFELVEELERVLRRDFPKLDSGTIIEAYLAASLVVSPTKKNRCS